MTGRSINNALDWPRALTLCAIFVCSPTIAYGDTVLLLHTASVMEMRVDRSEISILYRHPRPGLASVGVVPGTLLFQGTITSSGTTGGRRVEGTAFAFKGRCQPAPYPVRGTISGDAGFTLAGPGPERSKLGCPVLGHSWASPHAHLVFSILDEGE